MLIPYRELLSKYNIKPNGVFHIGASTGQEIEDYYKGGVERSIWIEAIPEVFDNLCKHIEPFKNATAYNECISDEDGKEVSFNITNNEAQSSSFLEMKTHKEQHPEVHVTETIQRITMRVDTLLAEENIDLSDYEFLNIDLQGAELLALKGMGDNLKKIKYAYIEVNREELYEGCPMIEQIDEYLSKFGLERAETRWTGFGWGDALYLNRSMIEKAKQEENLKNNNPDSPNYNHLAFIHGR